MPWRASLVTSLAAIAAAISAGTVVVDAIDRLVGALGKLRVELQALVDAMPPDEERPTRQRK